MVAQKNLWYLTVFSAEFLASAFLVFVGCLGDVDKSPYFTPNLLTSGFAWSMAVMTGISTFAAVSGGFMTPLITLSAFIHEKIDLITALIYLAAQIIGSYLGYAVLRSVIPNDFLSDPQGFCIVQPKLALESSFVIEFIISFIFITFLSAIVDSRNESHQATTSLKFGFLIMAIHVSAGPLTGAVVNPARALAPALYNLNFKNHWLYWLAPVSASAASSLLYKHLFAKDFSEKPREILNLEEVDATK